MAKRNEKPNTRPTILNRQAGYEYAFIDTYVAGIALTGTEIKSVREAKVQMQDAYCAFQGNELWVRNLQISPYTHGGYMNHEPTRPRKLLMLRKELDKLKKAAEEKGLTIVPRKLFFNDRNVAKLEIALAKGKKLFDKRQTIKAREEERASKRTDE